MNFDINKQDPPIIKVIGVGGGGSNAVNHMFRLGIHGVDFAVCNTDKQALAISPVPHKIQLGPTLTDGLGAGSKPEIGKLACEESVEEIKKYLTNNCKMLFVTAGMGGGTGTGAAPIICKAAQEMDVLTVGIVTLPFTFEGRRRQSHGMDGYEELKKHVDCLIAISNDKLRQIYGNLKVSEAFSHADDILATAAKGIAEIITVPGYVNVDFEDVNTVMRNSGVAIMGSGTATGPDRAKEAVDLALSSPLLQETNIKGAQHILLNITSGKQEVTMDEIFEITEFVQEEAGNNTDLIWGNCHDDALGDELCVTVIATGFDRDDAGTTDREENTAKVVVSLDDTESDYNSGGLRSIGYESEARKDNTVDFGSPVSRNTNDPFRKPLAAQEEEAMRKQRFLEEQRRKEKLNGGSTKYNQPDMDELENVPAYKRRGVNLDPQQTSNQSKFSDWELTKGLDDEPLELRKSNGFLDKRVD